MITSCLATTYYSSIYNECQPRIHKPQTAVSLGGTMRHSLLGGSTIIHQPGFVNPRLTLDGYQIDQILSQHLRFFWAIMLSKISHSPSAEHTFCVKQQQVAESGQ